MFNNRDERIARRSFLRGTAALGVGTAALGAGAACGTAKGQSPAPSPTIHVRSGAAAAAAQAKLPPPNRDGVKKPFDASLPPLLDSTTAYELVSRDDPVEVNTGTMMNAWTFGGTIPAPVLHVRQGDRMRVKFTNGSKMPHSVDFHAAFSPMSKGPMDLLAPGESMSIELPIPYPGSFMYHCGAPPVYEHIGSGMYGAVIVDPAAGWPTRAAHEWVLVASELYLQSDSGGKYALSADKLLSVRPDYVVFNGAAFQYLKAPLEAKAGELIRLHVVNAGPSLLTAFHVIGTLFETVYVGGNPANPLKGLQTWGIPPGDGATFELRIPDPGMYPFVTHAFAFTELGAIGVINVT